MKSFTLIPNDRIESRIFFIRGKKVMFDRDLAMLYGVETRILNRNVKRNYKRFPEDFMFQLNKMEFEIWKSQIGISNSEKMGLRKRPYIFTEQGVAMLSSVLNSERAIAVNIQIMRTFTKIREMLVGNKELRQKIEAMEKKYDKKFRIIFEAIKELMTEKKPKMPEFRPMAKIGFRTE